MEPKTKKGAPANSTWPVMSLWWGSRPVIFSPHQGATLANHNAIEPSPFEDGEVYDLILGDLDYCFDFYVNLAKQAQGPVLEIACGTGRIMIPVLEAGVDCEGLDLFPSMLEHLKRKAAAKNIVPKLHLADMANFSLERRYDLITITFNAFTHNLTQESQIACLNRCREHLLPGGCLVFDAFFPGLPYLSLPDNTRVLEGEMPQSTTGKTLRVYDTRRFDRINQIQHSLNEIELVDAEGKVETVQRNHCKNRWIYKGEMELLLRVAGFKRWRIEGDFDGNPLAKETDAMVVRAWA